MRKVQIYLARHRCYLLLPVRDITKRNGPAHPRKSTNRAFAAAAAAAAEIESDLVAGQTVVVAAAAAVAAVGKRYRDFLPGYSAIVAQEENSAEGVERGVAADSFADRMGLVWHILVADWHQQPFVASEECRHLAAKRDFRTHMDSMP